MSSKQKSATLNYQLTGYAQGYMNDLARVTELADRLAPICPVPGTTGQYKQFNDDVSFEVYATARARGGDPTRIGFSADDATFNCKPNALEVTVDQEDDRDAGEAAVGMLNPDEIAVKALLNATSLSRAKKTVDVVIAALAAVGGDVGKFSDPAIDPIAQLDEQIDLLATTAGDVNGIKVTMSLTAWRTIRNHPLVIKRCNGVQVGGITLDQLNSMLAVPVDVKAYAISYNSAAKGQAKDKKRLLAGTILMTYSQANPTQFDPSTFKRFTVGVSGVAAVRTYQAPSGLYRAHFVDWSEDLKQTSTAAKRIDLS